MSIFQNYTYRSVLAAGYYATSVTRINYINILAAAQLDPAFSLNVLPIYETACLLIELVLPLCLRSKIP